MRVMWVEVPSYQMFDSLQVACYSAAACAVPAAHEAKSYSRRNCLRIPVYALALAAQAAQPETGSGQLSTNTDIIRLISSGSWLSIGVLIILLAFSAIGIFGIGRCMFASNFPVDSLCASFDAIYSGFDQITKGFFEEERRALFHDNAVRIYRMEKR